MKVILTHIGSDIPPYAAFCLRQYRLFNPSAETVFIAGKNHLKARENLFKELNIRPIPSESLEGDRRIRTFRKLNWFKKWGIPATFYPSQPNFWHNAIERLFFIEVFMRQSGWKDVFHFENDVMIYSDLADIQKRIPAPATQMYITPVGDQWVACGLLYVPRHDLLGRFCDFVLKELPKGDERIKKERRVDIVSDMTLLKIFGEQEKALRYFPILPEGPHAYEIESFGSVFDSASWGQFAGGTNNGNPAGWAEGHHYIGKEILAGNCRLVWKEEGGLRTPFVEDKKGSQTPLANLHIHSKKLGEFMSRDRVDPGKKTILSAEPPHGLDLEARCEDILKNIAFNDRGELKWKGAVAECHVPVGDKQLERDRPKPYILRALEIFAARGGKIIVEIGTSGGRMFHRLEEDGAAWGEHCCNSGHSTLHFAMSDAQEVWTVDINPEATEGARKNLAESEYTRDRKNVRFVTQDGLEFLRNFSKPIDLLYLDGWDVEPGFYAENHLQAYLFAKDKLHDQSLILIDDTDVDNGGKGKWVIPKAIKDGYKIVFGGRQTLLIKKDA